MPLSGAPPRGSQHSIRCGSAVQFEDRFDADFPDSLWDQCGLRAESQRALVFVAAQFALDSNVSAFGESGDDLQPASQMPRIDATPCGIAMSRGHSSRRLPRPEVAFLGDRHGGARTEWCPETKQKLRRRGAPQEPRSSAETDGWNRKRSGNSFDIVSRRGAIWRLTVETCTASEGRGI
jgi:hypothetical protein